LNPDFWGFDIPHCRCYDSTGHKKPSSWPKEVAAGPCLYTGLSFFNLLLPPVRPGYSNDARGDGPPNFLLQA